MEWDLLANRLVTWGLGFVFGLPMYWTVDYVEKHLRQEVDFVNEKENSRRAANALGVNAPRILRDYVYIPKCFDRFSTSKILTMEFIDGVSCGDVQGLKDNHFSGKEVMNVICRLFSYVSFSSLQNFSDQIFRTGFIHADPHVGNILIRKNPNNSKMQIVCIFPSSNTLGSHRPWIILRSFTGIQ
jgi:aarF domain-containing kinase